MRVHSLVAIEGVTGVGKSTLIDSLCAAPRQEAVMRLPGSFRVLRRSLETNPDESPVAHLGYYLAATAEMGAIAARQAETQPVIFDRYFPSPLGLFSASQWLEERTVVELATPFVTASPIPDITLVLTANYETTRSRIAARPHGASREQAIHERSRSDEVFTHDWQGAIERHAEACGPTVVLDTTGLNSQNVFDAARELLATHLPLDL